MVILRADIERALDEIISQEEGMRFQGLAVVLGKKRWPELIARQRKKDFGLDAYAPASLTGNVGRGLAASTTPKLSKVMGDAKTGKENFPDLEMLLFVTPSKVGNADRRTWEADIRKECDLELHLIEREEIITQMLLPENAALCGSFLRIAVDVEPDVGNLLDKARRAAANVSHAWAARMRGHPLIELSTVRLERNGEPSEDRLAIDQIDQALLQSRRLVIEGPAGRGKTTTLVQLALRERATGIALLIELPAWISSRRAILDFVAGMPAFQAEGLTASDLARIQQSEPILLLLNGWNEIALSNSQEASTALAALERDFPSAGIVIASRTHHIVPPLPGAMRLRMRRLSRAQRVAYLAARLGNKMAELQTRIDADPSLDELTRTPFVLSEVASLFESGASIPSTKAGILAEVIRLQEQQIEHANALQLTPLFGQQTAYLKAIGTEMTRRGAVVLSEADARALVATVARGLVESGQIETVGAGAVLATLTAHHVLERVDYPEPAFRFEHQQVQEFYAALDLCAQLLSLADDEASTQRFIADYVNNVTWAEPLRMIAATFGERTGDVEIKKRNTQAGASLVRMALAVDPLFAAELSCYCGALVWRDIGAAVQERLRAIHAMGERSFREYAIAAMLATRMEAFGDILVPLLSAPSQQVRLGTYRLWPEFNVSSLGGNWREVVRGWTEEAREDFVSELLHHRVDADVVAFAAEDESSTVKKAAAAGLVWAGSDAELVRVVDSMDAQTFDELAQKELEYLPTSIRPRAVQAVRRQAESALAAAVRARAASRLIELGESGLEGILIEAILALSNGDVRNVGLHYFRPVLEQALRIDADRTSEWVAAMVADGAIHAAEDWLPFISATPERLIMDYVHRLGTENMGGRNIEGLVGVAAARANAKLAAHAFARLRELRLKINAQPRQRRDHEVQLQRQLEELFRRFPGDVAAAGILESVAVGNPLDILVTTGILSRVARQDVDRLNVPDRDLKARLRAYVKTGVDLVLHEDDFTGEQKANLASSIAQVGEPEDFMDLVRVIRADVDRVRRGRAAWVAGDRGAVGNGGIMSFAQWNIAAAMDLDPSGAAELLVELLAEPEYVSSVTSAMAQAYVSTQTTPSWGRILNYERMWAARENRLPLPPPDVRRERFAASLKDEAARLIDRSNKGEPVAGLLGLARALAIIGGHGATSTALEILALKGHRDEYRRLDAAEHALMSGVALPTEMTLELVDSFLAGKGDWLSDSDRHLLSRILMILPLVDDSAAGIARMREVLGTRRLHGSELRDIIVSLGHSRSDAAIDLLAELATDTSVFDQCQDCLVKALATLDTPRSREFLLGFVDPAAAGYVATRRWHFEDVVVERLADLALRGPDESTRLVKLCESDLPDNNRHLLSRVMSRVGTPQALAANLNLIDDARPSPVPRGVWDQLRDTFLARKARENDSNTYVVRSQASNETRARLFAMATGGDRKRQRSAIELLGQIEVWRLEEGKPADEPRHPDIVSGGLWPPT